MNVKDTVYSLWVVLLYAGRSNEIELTKICSNCLRKLATTNHIEYQEATELFNKRYEDGEFKRD